MNKLTMILGITFFVIGLILGIPILLMQKADGNTPIPIEEISVEKYKFSGINIYEFTPKANPYKLCILTENNLRGTISLICWDKK